MIEDKFNEDLEVEEIISLWIEKKYFDRDSNDYQYTRCDIPEYQERGIDAALQHPRLFKDDKAYYIDEKAASSYIRTNLKMNNIPTFAFELDCKRKGSTDIEDRVPGWLFGSKYQKTEYYLLSWVWADIDNVRGKNIGNKSQVASDNIRKVKCILVPKKCIQDYVTGFGINENNYMDKAKELRLSSKQKSLLSDRKTPNLQHSYYLEESPVNVIIAEYHLERMALDSFEVTI